MVNIGEKEVPGLIRNGAYCLEMTVPFAWEGMGIIRERIACFFGDLKSIGFWKWISKVE